MGHDMQITELSTTPVREPASEFFNRDISWLDFNLRVLAEAEDPRNKLLERVRFLAIFSSNQDEFFMKRIGLLRRKISQKKLDRSADGLTPAQQLILVRERVDKMTARQLTVWKEQIRPALESENIFIRTYDQLTPEQKAKADLYFDTQIFPVLTPLAVDSGHPFPFISNLSLSIGVLVRQPAHREHLFARIKVPQLFSRWITFSDGNTNVYCPLESLIEARLEMLFPGMEILEHHAFRVTRNAEVETDIEDPEDLLEVVQEELRARRFADTVRVQVPPGMSAEMLSALLDGLEISVEEVYESPGPLGFVDLMALVNVDRPDLKLAPWKPDADPALADPDTSIFAAIRKGDILVHHPYESFDTSVERFILSAVNDPKVLAIKMTLYRTSGDSPFVPALARAAESGKQVAVLVELKARFDEERNIQWARALETAGAHVVYGVLGLKTHTKTALIVRKEDDAVRCYAHIATGNYNSKTAQLYTDVGLLTCRDDICADVVDLFSFLTGRSLKRTYRKLLVAPVTMRPRFMDMIHREIANAKAGRKGRIIAKMNQLEDPEIIHALYAASQVGVQIDLVVRGFCCLRPGVPGLSDNIRVTSIIGRFLEHSRIFYFLNDTDTGPQEEFLIGSGDWMSRNLTYRVEAATPIEDSALREDLRRILDICLADNRSAWDLHADGSWSRRSPIDGEPERGTQQVLMDLTLKRSEAMHVSRMAKAAAEAKAPALEPESGVKS